jgi:antitoxin Phd
MGRLPYDFQNSDCSNGPRNTLQLQRAWCSARLVTRHFSASDRPQVVTRRGIETAVLVPIEEWNRLQRAARPSLKTLLLASDARTDNLIPERHRLRRRNVWELK